MNRREFIVNTASTGIAAAGLAAAGVGAAAPVVAEPVPNRALMKLGDQTEPTNETHVRYLARYGVESICGYPLDVYKRQL